MKRLMLSLILVVSIAGNACALAVSHLISVDPIFPFKKNAYSIVWGGGYTLKFVEDKFVFMAGVKGHLGLADMVLDDETGTAYGIYRDDWRLTRNLVYEASNTDPGYVTYLNAELSISFGWHVSYIMQRNQFVFLSVAAMLDSENFTGLYEHQFISGRYSVYLSLTSELHRLFDNLTYLTLSFGSTALQDPSKQGNAFYFLRTEFSMEFPVEFKHVVDKYKRDKEIEDEGKEQKGEGGAVWEE